MKSRRELAQGLFKKAANDLVAARAIVKTGRAFDTVCFHAQQAVEKSLKAILAAKDVSYPRRHDLAELLIMALPLLPEMEKFSETIITLTPFAVEIRYDIEFSPSGEIARSAIRSAEAVHRLCGKRLGIGKVRGRRVGAKLRKAATTK